MNAGSTPGGTGRLFHVWTALWLPAHRTVAEQARRDTRWWRRVIGQAAIVGAVLLALFATGWLLGLMIAPGAGNVGGGGTVPVHSASGVIGWVGVGTAGLLVGVLLAIEASRVSHE
jgi:hypothetical protein